MGSFGLTWFWSHPQRGSGPAGRDAPAVAEDQAITAQLAHGALYGVLFAVPQIALDPERQLQDRELRRVQDQDLREDRALHDLVLVSGRNQGSPDIFVVHGSEYLLCHAPGCSTSAGALFVGSLEA